MKKTTVSVSYDADKLAALQLYLEQKGITMEAALAQAVDALYAKHVPTGVREFLDLRGGSAPQESRKPRRASGKTEEPEHE